MSEQVGSVTRKKSSGFHGRIRFQSSFTIRWELEDKNFLKIDIICLDDSLKYRIMAIKTNEIFSSAHFLIGVQWLGTNCQMKHVRWGILLALNSPYLRI